VQEFLDVQNSGAAGARKLAKQMARRKRRRLEALRTSGKKPRVAMSPPTPGTPPSPAGAAAAAATAAAIAAAFLESPQGPGSLGSPDVALLLQLRDGAPSVTPSKGGGGEAAALVPVTAAATPPAIATAAEAPLPVLAAPEAQVVIRIEDRVVRGYDIRRFKAAFSLPWMLIFAGAVAGGPLYAMQYILLLTVRRRRSN
jgi:hypothetical protein